MFGRIYRTHNMVNGNTYIGQTIKTGIPFDKYLGSGLNISSAFKKYGKENFYKEVLIECDSKDQLDRMERIFISLLKPEYNISPGGQFRQSKETYKIIAQKNKGRVRSAETRKKMSESAKIKIFTPEHKKHLGDSRRGKKINRVAPVPLETKQRLSLMFSGEGNPFYGKTHSQEVKAKISSLKMGNKNCLGKKLSEETKDKIRKSRIGELNPGWGKPRSEETKQKIRLSKVGKPRSDDVKLKISETLTGRKLPQYQIEKMKIARAGKNNAMYGKKRTDEEKKKIRDSLRKYQEKSLKKVICIETKKIYGCAAWAEKENNIEGISKVCRGKHSQCGGFHWMFLDKYLQSNNIN